METVVTGRITVIGDVETFDSGFSKRMVVVTTEDQYPQPIKLEFFKDKASLLDNYSIGDRVEVAYNLLGNEYNGKYYINANAWKIKKADGEPAASVTPLPVAESNDAEDDLPFSHGV